MILNFDNQYYETAKDIYIEWRVEGLDGIASGTIGWPEYPVPTPSTLEFTSKQFPGQWIRPKWDNVWFPDAFQGTMAQLLRAVETGTEPDFQCTWQPDESCTCQGLQKS